MRATQFHQFVRGLAVATAITVGATGVTIADELDEAMDVRTQGNAKSSASQTVVDDLSDQTDELYGEYRQILRQVDELRVYNGKMVDLLQSQDEELASLGSQIERAALVGRQVTPLMLKMIEAIDRFVDLDVPFNIEERTKRVDDLRELMDRADVSDAEKYRVIMEAYQIENEFGRTIEAYQGTLDLNGLKRTVDFLRFGRIALVYQTLDGAESGYWDQTQRKWSRLDQEYLTPVKEGVRIARKQKPPSLIKLPIPAPEAL